MTDKMEQEPSRGNLDRKSYIGVNIIKFDELKGIISTDLSGCFPMISVRGNA